MTTVFALLLLLPAEDFFTRVKAAQLMHEKGEFAQAEKLLLEALRDGNGADDPQRAVALNNLGSAQHNLGRYREAEQNFRRSLTLCKNNCGDVLQARFTANLANLYLESGQRAKAERLPLQLVRDRLSVSCPDDPEIARLEASLGALADVRGRYAESEKHYRQALVAWEKQGPLGAEALQALNNLGLVYAKAGRREEGLSASALAQGIAERTLPLHHPLRAVLLASVGSLRLLVYGPADAEAFYRQALELAETSLGPHHPLLGQILTCYAVALDRNHRKVEARECRRRARSILEAAPDYPGKYTVDVTDLLRRSDRSR